MPDDLLHIRRKAADPPPPPLTSRGSFRWVSSCCPCSASLPSCSTARWWGSCWAARGGGVPLPPRGRPRWQLPGGVCGGRQRQGGAGGRLQRQGGACGGRQRQGGEGARSRGGGAPPEPLQAGGRWRGRGRGRGGAPRRCHHHHQGRGGRLGRPVRLAWLDRALLRRLRARSWSCSLGRSCRAAAPRRRCVCRGGEARREGVPPRHRGPKRARRWDGRALSSPGRPWAPLRLHHHRRRP